MSVGPISKISFLPLLAAAAIALAPGQANAETLEIGIGIQNTTTNTVTGGADRNILIVTTHDDEITWKSLRNVPSVHLLAEDQLNTYDVLDSDYLVFTQAALSAFVERGSE